MNVAVVTAVWLRRQWCVACVTLPPTAA